MYICLNGIIVPPEVEVIASQSRISSGTSVILFCNVTRSNPDIVPTFQWENTGMGLILSENSEMLTVNLSSLVDFGMYRCTVTNTAGFSGNGTVTIEQGCKLAAVGLTTDIDDFPYSTSFCNNSPTIAYCCRYCYGVGLRDLWTRPS